MKKPETVKKTLTAAEWLEAEQLWATGETTAEGLAARFGIPEGTFRVRFSRKKLKHGSMKEEASKAMLTATAQEAASDAALLAARIRETKEEHYKMSQGIQKLAWKEVITATKNATPMHMIQGNLKALKLAADILKVTREERFAVLGLDRPDAQNGDEVPELIVRELTAEQVATLRDRTFSEFDLPEDAEDLSTRNKELDEQETSEDDDGIVETS